MTPRSICWLLTLLAGGSFAEPQPIYPIPLPPSPSPAYGLSPRGGVRAEASMPTAVTFRWKHGAPTVAMPQAASANYFIVCAYNAAANETCATTPLRWVRAATALSRTPVTNPLTNPQIVLAYDYRLDVQTIEAARHDRTHDWKVLACASMVATSCTDITPVPLTLSTRNLRAENISSNGVQSNRNQLVATAVGSNTGSSNSGEFSTLLIINEVFYDPVARSCRTDLSWPDLPPDAYVIRGDGTHVPVSNFRRADGTYNTNVRNIRGIYEPRMASAWDDATTSLAAGASNVSLVTVGTYPQLSHDPNSASDRAAWIMFMQLDADSVFRRGTITEFDEVDNLRIECKHF